MTSALFYAIMSLESEVITMKRKTILALLALSVALFMFGCEKKQEDTAIEEITLEAKEETPEAAQSEENTPSESADDEVPPQEGMVRSRLTNEWVSADVASLRPLAVMIPNDKSALPQYNISNADVYANKYQILGDINFLEISKYISIIPDTYEFTIRDDDSERTILNCGRQSIKSGKFNTLYIIGRINSNPSLRCVFSIDAMNYDGEYL